MPAGIALAADRMKSLPGRLTRRRMLVACVLLVAILAALAASPIQPRRYTTTAAILLPAAGREQLLVAAFAQRPREQVVAERTARALDRIRTPEQLKHEVEVDGGQASARIRVTDADDSVAARVATEFARQYATAQIDLAYKAVLRGQGRAPASTGGGSRNLAPSASFERGARGWGSVRSRDPAWGVTDSWAAQGRASLRARSNGASTGATTPGGVAGIPVEGGAPYGFSAVVRVRRLDQPRQAYMRISWSSVSGEFLGYSPRLYLPRSGTTRVLYRQPQRSPDDAAYARVELIAEPARGKRADLYLDEVSLERIGATRSAPDPRSDPVRIVLAALRSGPLVEPATVPSEPSEPRVGSTLLVALLMGSFVAFAVAALTGRRDAR
jgi:hypothetical protein